MEYSEFTNGLKILTSLRLGLIHLNHHKLNQNVKLTIFVPEIENNVRFHLHCHHFSRQRQTILNNVKWNDEDIFYTSDSELINVHFCGGRKCECHINSKILNFSMEFILMS